jgi:signal transduction histidine kinase
LLSKIPEVENFQLIGDIYIPTDSQEFKLEVHCRLNKSDKDLEIEFLFNDVSRTMLKEKQLAEFKYKSLYLSKVAHEFKNPLICVSELLNEAYDVLPEKVQKDERIIINFEQIKSLSSYLQILIKDLNYFSLTQFGKIKEFKKKEIDLYSVIDFCKKIVKILLLKSNKNSKVDFNVKIEDRVPKKILTDEWKLKQVLINLLSNSVKFTIFGSICLEVTLEQQNDTEENSARIKFLVKDSGVGIKENKEKNFIKPLRKDSKKAINVYNEHKAKLGLSIAKEILSTLGHQLEFESKQGEGSKFWFYLSLDKDFIIKKFKAPVILINNNPDNAYHILNNDIGRKIETDVQSKFSNSLNEDSIVTKQLNDLVMVKPLNLDVSSSDNSSSDESSDHEYGLEIKESIIKSENMHTRHSIFSKVQLNFLLINLIL